MALEFLSDDQVAAYGRFAGPTGRAELERFFFLDDADRALVARRHGDHNRLGFSLQLGTVRFTGMFLADPLDVPGDVVDYLAGQLGVADASSVKRYAERQSTQWEHAGLHRRGAAAGGPGIHRRAGLDTDGGGRGRCSIRRWPGCGNRRCSCPGRASWPAW